MGNVKTKQKKDRSLVALTVTLIVIGVLIALIFAYTIVDSFGVFGRMTTVAESPNATVNENMVEYLKFQQINMLSQYLGTYTSTYIQQMSTVPDGASISSFDVQMMESVKTTLLYYEAALADKGYLATVDIKDFDRQADLFADNLEKSIEETGYSISDSFYAWGLSKGVSKKDISAMQKLSLICSDYQEYLSDTKFAAGEADYKANPDSYKAEMEKDEDKKNNYFFADYMTYVYKTSEETITKNEKLVDGAKDVSIDELKEIIKAAFEKETEQENALAAITENKDLHASYSTSTSGYQKWMFESDRKAEDTYLSVSTSSGTTTYTLYVLEKPCYLDETIEMKDFYYVAFPYASEDGDATKEEAKKMADEFLAALLQGGANGTTFDKMVREEKYSTYSTNKVYREEANDESMGEEISEFVFGENVKVGDAQVVEVVDSDSKTDGTYYVILVSKEYDIPNWAANYIINKIADELEEWEEADKSYTDLGVKLSDSYQKKLDKYNKATETTTAADAETTTAADEETTTAEKEETTTAEEETTTGADDGTTGGDSTETTTSAS